MNKTARVFFPIAAVCVLLVIVLGVVGAVYQGKEEAGNEGVDAGPQIPGYIQSSCISCHGTDLRGDYGPTLYDLDLSKEEIVTILQDGIGQMPGDLIPGQEEEAAEYLLTLTDEGSPAEADGQQESEEQQE